MKNILAIALMTLGSVAFGSTARMNALGSAVHLTDMKTVFITPTDMLVLPEAMEINFGAATVGATTDGGMIRAMGDARLGFFVGAVDKARTGTYLGVENPFTVAYAAKAGDMAWGVLFNYSSSNKKATTAATDDQNQNFMSVVGSLEIKELTVALDLGLTDKAKGTGTDDTAEMSKAPITVSAKYAMGDWTYYGAYMMATDKTTVTSVETKTTKSDLTIGAINATKAEGADFFYGLAYQIQNEKTGSDKTDTTTMPVIVGIEADAASWLTLRGSVEQNVLLGGTKKTGSVETGLDTPAHDTTVAAGMGFKFAKSNLDITLKAAGTGDLNSNLGANAGFTYLF